MLACVCQASLGGALGAYRSWVGARLDGEDRWLDGLAMAWPLVVAAMALNWPLLLLPAALVLLGAGSLGGDRPRSASRT